LVYGLISMLAGSGSASGSVAFNTKDACETAAKAITKADRPICRRLCHHRVRGQGIGLHGLRRDGHASERLVPGPSGQAPPPAAPLPHA